MTATFANYPSPYEDLKREIQGSSSPAGAPPTTTVAIDPITPGKQSALPDMSMTPGSSPFAMPASNAPNDDGRKTNNDVLLHRVLDKNYRIAATPHTARKANARATQTAKGTTPGTITRTGTARFLDSSPMSSPDVPAPQLRADLFSPAKIRTPGVSVQTPRMKRGTRDAGGGATREETERTKDVFGNTTAKSVGGRFLDSDSEDDTNDLGFSPPKTMQFHIPQSRILQTPGKSSLQTDYFCKMTNDSFAAREASKRIVEDLLLTAGGDITDELDVQEEDSPSVVRRDERLDDSF